MIKTYRSSKTIITKSTKGGKGLFARENILPGEIIAIRAGQIVDTVEASKRDKETGDDWKKEELQKLYGKYFS